MGGNGIISALLAATTVLAAQSLVIQGRITAIKGALVTVKTPDGYPGGGPGGHALFVKAGPTYKVEVSGARILLADGKQADKQPLAVGDRVLMVLSEPDVNQTYVASLIERIVEGDKMTSH